MRYNKFLDLHNSNRGSYAAQSILFDRLSLGIMHRIFSVEIKACYLNNFDFFVVFSSAYRRHKAAITRN